MNLALPTRLSWLGIMLATLGVLVWSHHARIGRAREVSALNGASIRPDATTSTGYVDGKRWLVLPEHEEEGYRWVMETQLMLERDEWRVRHVDFENVPAGHAVLTPSPYRWWLGLVARIDHHFSGRPLGASVEQAALHAGPTLQVLLLLISVIFVFRRFGAASAVILAIGLATMQPFAGAFQAAAPRADGLSFAIGSASVLVFLAGIAVENGRRLLLASGLLSGLGLWIDAGNQGIILAGCFAGALLVICLRSRQGDSDGEDRPTPWRWWAVSGALASVAGWFVEYAPTHLDWRADENHPVYALAFLGLGEFLVWADRREGKDRIGAAPRFPLLAVLAFAASVVGGWWFVFQERADQETSDGLAAAVIELGRVLTVQRPGAWLREAGLAWSAVAACSPALIAIAAAFWLMRSGMSPIRKRVLACALGPVVAAAIPAGWDFAAWGLLDAMLLALLVALVAGMRELPALGRRITAVVLGLALLPGVVHLVKVARVARDLTLTPLEAESLLERELAHWLRARTGLQPAVVLAPPTRTLSLVYFGGLRGVGSLSPENRNGLVATVRIAAETSIEEAQATVRRAGITHFVLPSWDRLLEELATLGADQPRTSLVKALRQWLLPFWLRPVPFQPPEIAGERQSVQLFEVVEEQDEASALAYLVEYFLETEERDLAASVGRALERFPTDLRTTIAQAQLAAARGDRARFSELLGTLQTNTEAGYAQMLAWDQRLSLAILFAQARQPDLARELAERCLAETDANRLRRLSLAKLYRLQVLARAYRLQFSSPELRRLALDLLTPDARERLEK